MNATDQRVALQNLRYQLGYTQTQLAAAIGMSTRSVARFENDGAEIPRGAVEKIVELSKVQGADPEWWQRYGARWITGNGHARQEEPPARTEAPLCFEQRLLDVLERIEQALVRLAEK